MRKISLMTLLFVSTLVLVQSTTPASAQGEVNCTLRSLDSGTMLGKCVSENWEAPISLGRPSGQPDLMWVGGIFFDDNTMPLEIGTYQYKSGPRLIARYFAWFPLQQYEISSSGMTISWDTSVEAPPSETDLRILELASTKIVVAAPVFSIIKCHFSDRPGLRLW